MNQKVKEALRILISLEPVFKQAGDLAKKLRPTALAENKLQTGVSGIDIVTDSDLAVQEFILSEMAKTSLVDCSLIAEENTPLVSKFKGTNGLVLTLDPIDGTKIYATKGDFYSVIICLHDGQSYIYSYCYYPEVNWARRVANDEVVDFGNLPYVATKPDLDLDHVIVHAFRKPETMAPEIYKEMTDRGYMFKSIDEVTRDDDAWPCTLLYLNQVAGYYTDNPGAYDGLCALHYGQVRNMEVHSNVDLSNYFMAPSGPRYPGWYLVLRK